MAGFQKATKKQAKARVALDGPSGAGKTWTALTTATALAAGGRVAVIDSERGSASKYASDFDFDVMELSAPFHPKRYIEGIRAAADGGYAVLVIDSLTHAWSGPGGVLEIVDAAAMSDFRGNKWAAWSVGTPLWSGLIDEILGAPMHVIATMRSKTKWVEGESKGGSKKYERQGTEPQARDGVEFEFDVVGDMDLQHNLIVVKSRAGNRIERLYREPGDEFGKAILSWLDDGAPDTKALARELMDTAGDRDALTKALAEAKIGSADLADEKKLAKARKIAEGIRDARPTRREPDDPPADDPTPAPEGHGVLL